MPKQAMTREEARGVLQQLAKLWQSRLGEAIAGLHEALLADLDLEADVLVLRREREALTAARTALQAEIHEATQEARKSQGALRTLRERHGQAERDLAALWEAIAQARRDREREAAEAQREHAAAQAAWQEAAGKERASRLAAIEREVAVHRERLDGEIAGLEARKAALEGALADVFSRYGASR